MGLHGKRPKIDWAEQFRQDRLLIEQWDPDKVCVLCSVCGEKWPMYRIRFLYKQAICDACTWKAEGPSPAHMMEHAWQDSMTLTAATLIVRLLERAR